MPCVYGVSKIHQLALPVFLSLSSIAAAVDPWSCQSYPDEAGFQARMASVLPELASRDYLHRQMSRSSCPDTGNAVYSWAIPGEPVRSPYTGREFIQSRGSYFGPRERDGQGRISAFGGDSLKVGLIPPTARLLLDPDSAGPHLDGGSDQRVLLRGWVGEVVNLPPERDNFYRKVGLNFIQIKDCYLSKIRFLPC